MSYTREEILIVEDAVATSSCHLGAAQKLFVSFIENYFESEDATARLLHDVNNRHEMISAQLYAIFHLLYEAKCGLDAFTDPESKEISSFLLEARELQEVVNVLNQKESCHE